MFARFPNHSPLLTMVSAVSSSIPDPIDKKKFNDFKKSLS